MPQTVTQIAEHPRAAGALAPEARGAFLFAGRARFTLVSGASGAHFTYQLQISDDGRVYFVRVRAGDEWVYIGHIQDGDRARLHRSRGAVGQPPPSFRALAWYLRQPMTKAVTFLHAGTCGKCGRELTNPESIATGLGPVCAGR